MKNKSGIVWSFFFIVMLAGCGTHQQLTSEAPVIMPQAPQASTSAYSAPEPDTIPEQDTGYRIRPIEIEIAGGRPYLPVGAELSSKDGKVDLGDVIKAMADHKGFSVSWADDVDQQRPVDCHVMAADDFHDALDNILRQLDYFYEIEEDTIVVRYKETKEYRLAMPNFTEEIKTTLGGNMLPKTEAEAGLDAKATLDIDSDEFNFWDDLKESLVTIVDCDGCPEPIIDRTLGTISVTASKKVHEEVAGYLALLEKEAYKQVIIEAKIIEVSLSDESEKGIDWENVFRDQGVTIDVAPENNGEIWSKDNKWNRFLNALIIDDTSWSVTLSAFEQFGDTRILSNPKLHILNGHSSVLSAGEVRKYLESCEVTELELGSGIKAEAKLNAVTEGLSIAIKANIVDDDSVMLYVFPAITRLIQMRDIFNSDCGLIQAPETAVREMATYAKVRDGEFLVIGGLISENKATDVKKVPFMGDLPYLGRAFSYESIETKKTELVILLKPKIVTENL